jgi:asparagine synthase (glutamine-hydrolysing)
VLGRDRTGIKPLHYAVVDGVFVFASEAKGLLAYPGFNRELDLVALDQYLTYHYVPTPRSIYVGVRKVRPGHSIVVERGRHREQAYWSLDLSTAADEGVPEGILAERLWYALRESVRLEMISDVPLGVFLSGGIDSSAVAAAMVELSPGQVRSFSVGFEDPSFDESRHARRVAAYLGTSHSELILEPRLMWELVPNVATFMDEPLADASIIPTYLLSRFTRQQVKVALGGDGGDELFAGYSTLQAHRLAAYYLRIPPVLRERLIAPLVRALPVSYDNVSLDFRIKRFINGVDRPLAERHHLWLGPGGHDGRAAVLSPEIRAQLGRADVFEPLGEHVVGAAGYDELSQVLYLDMKMYLEGDILPKVDRASMAVSLEVRVPLLNRLMVEFAAGLPLDLKLRGLTRKYLMRRALSQRLPQEIIDRPKKGFGIPVAKWFRGELRELLLDVLGEERIRRGGLFEPTHVSRLITEHLSGTRDNRSALWNLLIFELWRERYLGGGDRPVGRETSPAVQASRVGAS